MFQGAEKTLDRLSIHLTNLDGPKSIFFLTPCHELPFYTFVHDPQVKMGFFDCSPQVGSLLNEAAPNEVKERRMDSWRQRFWDNPLVILDEVFPPELLNGTSVDYRMTSDVYIDPQSQRGNRDYLWFGGLSSRYQLMRDTKKTQQVDKVKTEPILHHSRISDIMGKNRKMLSLASFANCLKYRFETPLRARELPNFFVVPSALLQVDGIDAWFQSHNYKMKDSIFHSFISEHPQSWKPLEFMSRIFIFERLNV